MEALWFCLLILTLAGYVVLGGTDLGVGMLYPLLARNEQERMQAIGSIRPVWKPNEVWLLAAGGTMFLAFPTALAASFSGFYLALTIVVWLLAFRGLGIELRHHISDSIWRQFWDVALWAGSLLLALFLGTALGNVVRGVPIDEHGVFFEPLWTDFRVGQKTGLIDWYTILAGLAAVVALANHGALWLAARAEGPVRDRACRFAVPLGITVILLLAILDLASFAARLEFQDAIRSRPWGVAFPVMTIGALLAAQFFLRRSQPRRAYLASCAALFCAMATAAVGVFPNILPSRAPGRGLTIYDASVSHHGLAVALWWWIPGMLLVAGYFAFIHRNLGRTFSPGDH
jgi:cytochrome d ubiquinol oxidase subunit II